MKLTFLKQTSLVILSFGLWVAPGIVLSDTHFVAPTGDVNQDGDNIQAAVDAASSGDTILLGPGTFVLGKYLEEDTAWVSTSRGSFQYFADLAFWDVRDPIFNPWYEDFGGGPDTPPFPQVIVVTKPLTIEGTYPPGSTTITAVNTWLDYPFGATLYGDANGFLFASSDVTIRNLRFYNMHYGVRIISAGTVIEDLVFDTPGPYNLMYLMDTYAAYPYFPSRKSPVKSYLRRTTWLNTNEGIHLYGSEVEVTDNYFEIRNSDSTEYPFSWYAIVFGGIPDQVPGIFSVTECRNNLIQSNVVEGDENSWFGAFYFAGHGPGIAENKITGNTVEHMLALVESHGRVPVNRNDIVGNTVMGGPLIFDNSYGIFLDEVYVAPFKNLFSGNVFIDVSYPMVLLGGKSNLIIGNDYTASGVPGWSSGGGSIFLSDYTKGNYVLEKDFPEGTTTCDQVLDLGNNAIPGGGVCMNNPEQAPHQLDVHVKQMEMRGMQE